MAVVTRSSKLNDVIDKYGSGTVRISHMQDYIKARVSSFTIPVSQDITEETLDQLESMIGPFKLKPSYHACSDHFLERSVTIYMYQKQIQKLYKYKSNLKILFVSAKHSKEIKDVLRLNKSHEVSNLIVAGDEERTYDLLSGEDEVTYKHESYETLKQKENGYYDLVISIHSIYDLEYKHLDIILSKSKTRKIHVISYLTPRAYQGLPESNKLGVRFEYKKDYHHYLRMYRNANSVSYINVTEVHRMLSLYGGYYYSGKFFKINTTEGINGMISYTVGQYNKFYPFIHSLQYDHYITSFKVFDEVIFTDTKILKLLTDYAFKCSETKNFIQATQAYYATQMRINNKEMPDNFDKVLIYAMVKGAKKKEIIGEQYHEIMNEKKTIKDGWFANLKELISKTFQKKIEFNQMRWEEIISTERCHAAHSFEYNSSIYSNIMNLMNSDPMYEALLSGEQNPSINGSFWNLLDNTCNSFKKLNYELFIGLPKSLVRRMEEYQNRPAKDVIVTFANEFASSKQYTFEILNTEINEVYEVGNTLVRFLDQKTYEQQEIQKKKLKNKLKREKKKELKKIAIDRINDLKQVAAYDTAPLKWYNHSSQYVSQDQLFNAKINNEVKNKTAAEIKEKERADFLKEMQRMNEQIYDEYFSVPNDLISFNNEQGSKEVQSADPSNNEEGEGKQGTSSSSDETENFERGDKGEQVLVENEVNEEVLEEQVAVSDTFNEAMSTIPVSYEYPAFQKIDSPEDKRTIFDLVNGKVKPVLIKEAENIDKVIAGAINEYLKELIFQHDEETIQNKPELKVIYEAAKYFIGNPNAIKRKEVIEIDGIFGAGKTVLMGSKFDPNRDIYTSPFKAVTGDAKRTLKEKFGSNVKMCVETFEKVFLELPVKNGTLWIDESRNFTLGHALTAIGLFAGERVYLMSGAEQGEKKTVGPQGFKQAYYHQHNPLARKLYQINTTLRLNGPGFKLVNKLNGDRFFSDSTNICNIHIVKPDFRKWMPNVDIYMTQKTNDVKKYADFEITNTFKNSTGLSKKSSAISFSKFTDDTFELYKDATTVAFTRAKNDIYVMIERDIDFDVSKFKMFLDNSAIPYDYLSASGEYKKHNQDF